MLRDCKILGIFSVGGLDILSLTIVNQLLWRVLVNVFEVPYALF